MTTTTELRCSYCLMPAEVTNGVVDVHDYPYAARNYGRCKGSGEPALTGPATPPLAWGVSYDTYVSLGVLPSPLPTVQRDGWTVTITGIRFIHSVPCAYCRVTVFTSTEGGVITIGFDHKGRGFERERAGGRASYSGACPNDCGHRITIGGRWGDKPQSRPVAEGRTVQYREWERLRRDLGVLTADMTPADLERLRTA